MATSSNKKEGAASAALSDDELDREIHAEVVAAEEGHRTALQHAIRAGELLTEKKGRLAHGEWLPWLDATFTADPRTAQNYMTLFANTKRVSHLGSVREGLAAIRDSKEEPSKPKRPKTTAPEDPLGSFRDRLKNIQPNKWGHLPRWTWQDLETAKAVLKAKTQKSPTGRRLHDISGKRAAARKAGDPSVFWNTSYEIAKLTGLLESLEVDDIELDEETLDTINDLHDDMLRLQEWTDKTIGAVQGRLGEQTVRLKIAGLRGMTVEAGCTAAEAENAQKVADRLEKKLSHVLGVVKSA